MSRNKFDLDLAVNLLFNCGSRATSKELILEAYSQRNPSAINGCPVSKEDFRQAIVAKDNKRLEQLIAFANIKPGIVIDIFRQAHRPGRGSDRGLNTIPQPEKFKSVNLSSVASASL